MANIGHVNIWCDKYHVYVLEPFSWTIFGVGSKLQSHGNGLLIEKYMVLLTFCITYNFPFYLNVISGGVLMELVQIDEEKEKIHQQVKLEPLEFGSHIGI